MTDGVSNRVIGATLSLVYHHSVLRVVALWFGNA